MSSTLNIIGIICAVFAAAFLLAAIVVVFSLNIKEAIREYSGSGKSEQLAAIKKESGRGNRQNIKANIYEELEKSNAKPNGTTGKNDRRDFSASVTSNVPVVSQSIKESDTVLLNKNINALNPDFVIDKDIKFVCTDEVLS